MPKVSIILTSFNHGKYIREAIDSALAQSFVDFELIIWDDASTDDSWETIKSYRDPRIKALRNEVNERKTINKALLSGELRGDYVAIHHSDDIWELDKLEQQVAYLDANPVVGAVFTWVQFVDDYGNNIENDWFNQQNKSRWDWLRDLFLMRNHFAHPSVLIRKDVYREVGVYHLALCQAPDAEMWSRVLIKKPVHILQKRLTKHRIFEDRSNASAHRVDTIIRTYFEWNVLRKNYLEITNIDDLIAIFPTLERYRNTVGYNIKYLLAMACLEECSDSSAWHLALSWLIELLNDPRQASDIRQLYSFTTNELFKLTGKFDVYALGKTAERDAAIAERDAAIAEHDAIALRHCQLETQHQRLQDQHAGLVEEASRLGYRAVRRVRNILQGRLSWAYVFFTRLLLLSLKLSNFRFRPVNNYLQLTSKLRAGRQPTIINEPWPANKPLVSIVIPCFNYGRFLNEAIDSVLSQTFQDFEIIVVDDESTDAQTLEVLETLNKPKTRLIRQKNQRVSAARNKGIAEAKGKYICCLDADDLLAPTYLEKCVFILETKHLDVCYSWVQLFGEDNLLWTCGPFLIDELLKGNQVSTAAVFRKSVWERAKGYSTEMLHGYEDWEFWIRIAKLGARGHLIPEPLFLYRKHGVSLTTSTDLIHTKLCEQIKLMHNDLFSGVGKLVPIKMKQFGPDYVVRNPLCNLTRKVVLSSKTFS